MKIVFAQEERDYLDYILKAVYAKTSKFTQQGNEEDQKHFRAISKMKYKFAGSGSYVNLTVKERDTLSNILNVRDSLLRMKKDFGPEGELLLGVMDKLYPAEVAE